MLLKKSEQDEYRDFLLRFARKCLKAKNYHQADLALQVCQQRYPNHPVAYNLHSMLAYDLGLYNQADAFVSTAIRLWPNFQRALDNQKLIRDRLTQANNNETERTLLIHSWGSGLGFEVLYLLQQLMIAELTSRKPVIYWGANSLYNDHPDRNCFTEYFEPITNTHVDELTPLHEYCYPKYWQERELTDHIRRTQWFDKRINQQFKMTGLYYLNRNEKLLVGGEYTSIKNLLPWIPVDHRLHGLPASEIYRDLMSKYIKPKEHIQRRANSFLNSAFNECKFIAIHLRGTDKNNEKQSADIATINLKLINQLDEMDNSLDIFVMTDDVRQISAMKKRFGKRVKSIDVTRSSDNKLGVHHTANNKRKITEEVLVDMLIAAKSEHFFGCGFSYLACCVSFLRNKKYKDATTLLPYDITSRFIDIPQPGVFGIK